VPNRGTSAPHGELHGAGHLIDRAVANIAHGRFERSLAGLTAVAAAVSTSEIFIAHPRHEARNHVRYR
jgi:hypothetical protein